MPHESSGTEEARPSFLSVSNVVKQYGDDPAVRGVSFGIDRGDVLSILGPSGSGKSTLLRCINCLEDISSGEIRLDGKLIGYRLTSRGMVPLKERDRAEQRRHFGMVFQAFNLFPHMTALENVMEAPVRVKGLRRSRAVELAQDRLNAVGLDKFVDRYPSQLSGGQQQRVAIARALCMEPDVLLLDEPTSALDPELVDEVLGTIRDLSVSGITMLIVTHEVSFAQDVSNRMILMRDGRIVLHGTPDEVVNSEHAGLFFASISRLPND